MTEDAESKIEKNQLIKTKKIVCTVFLQKHAEWDLIDWHI